MINNPYEGTPYGHNNHKILELSDVNKYKLEDYGLTVDAVKSNHFGIDVTDPRNGEYLPDSFYKSKLESAVAQVEKELNIVILPRLLDEHHDFYSNDFNSNMYIHTFQRPILQVEKVILEYGGSMVFNYPTRWWRVYNLEGHIQMLPTLLYSGEQGPLNLAQVYSGYPMIAGIPYTVASTQAPQMFHIQYVAGMLPPARRGVTQPYEMHPDLWSLIVKIALREVFQQWGRLIIGAGIANMRLEIDGVSQSIDTTQSAMYSGASADIELLNKDIAELKATLKSYYGYNLGII